MNKLEALFLSRVKKDVHLVSQPCIRRRGVVVWKPDFLDIDTGVYYEVVNATKTFYAHKSKGHLSYMTKNKLKLVIVRYSPALDRFFLMPYTVGFHLGYVRNV